MTLSLHQFLHQKNAAPRGATFCTSGGSNYIYSIISRQEQENPLDVVTDRTKIINFYVYALLDPKSSLCFVTLYVANQLEIILEKLCELFFVSTPVGESILAERVYRDCLSLSITRTQ